MYSGFSYGEIYGENLRRKFMGKIYGENLRGKYAGNICGENLRGNLLEKFMRKVTVKQRYLSFNKDFCLR